MYPIATHLFRRDGFPGVVELQAATQQQQALERQVQETSDACKQLREREKALQTETTQLLMEKQKVRLLPLPLLPSFFGHLRSSGYVFASAGAARGFVSPQCRCLLMGGFVAALAVLDAGSVIQRPRPRQVTGMILEYLLAVLMTS